MVEPEPEPTRHAPAVERIVLASGSPRRRELLERLGLQFEVQPADIDESVRAGEVPTAYVRRLSRAKAAAVRAADGVLVIAADTTVDVEGSILGKPADANEARAMLLAMSGRRHHVHTGVTLRIGGSDCTPVVITAVVTTAVDMVPIDEATLDWYIATGEPFDKAGGYAIQGAGGALVARVEGSVSNVVGLPLTTVIELARELGLRIPGAS